MSADGRGGLLGSFFGDVDTKFKLAAEGTRKHIIVLALQYMLEQLLEDIVGNKLPFQF